MRILLSKLHFDKTNNHKFPQSVSCELRITNQDELTPYTRAEIITNINILYYDDSLPINKLRELITTFDLTPSTMLTYVTLDRNHFTVDNKLKNPVIQIIKKHLLGSPNTLITPEAKRRADEYFSKNIIAPTTYDKLKNCTITTVNDLIKHFNTLDVYSTASKIVNDLATL